MIDRVQVLKLGALAAILASVPALAAVSADEAKRLGADLLPWGAEKAGNKDGTIPEYTGAVKIPAGYDPKKPGLRPDPYGNEKPLFSITAQNLEKYADKVSEGQKAMFKKFPTFRMDVYPSHRSMAYPAYVIDNTLKNAVSCKTKDSELSLDGCYGGVPFPIPKDGNQVMWNHITSFTHQTWFGELTTWTVTSTGRQMLMGQNSVWNESPFYDPKRKGPAEDKTIYWKLRVDENGPPRIAGGKILIQDPVNMATYGRRAWQYIPGQRRIKLAPDLSYDTPSPQSGGAAIMDELQLFMGAQDRFDFKLAGKRELYIPYNNFKFADPALCPEATSLQKNHLNPDCIRWELHRVWQVNATLKPGYRHVYSKRTFYFDEDAPGAGVAENYDASGAVYRVVQALAYPMYESTGIMTNTYYIVDLSTGIYNINGVATSTGGWYTFAPKSDNFYSPEGAAGEGIR